MGEYRDGKCWNGAGALKYNAGSYTGVIVNGRKHGQGRFAYADGSV